jgi:predicted nucleic acid-binding Zn ribbon protein
MANVVEPRACPICGQVLPPQEGRGRVRRYCSARCRDKARRRRTSSDHPASPVVNDYLTNEARQVYLDNDGNMSSARYPVVVDVAGAARRLVDELDNPSSPAGAVAAARELSSAADAALQAAVDRARDAGQTWRDIGHALGTSRQAAFQRFGHPVDPRTGVTMVRTVPPSAAHRVTEFLDRFTAGLWEEVLEAFDEPMRQRHDSDRLASGWAQMIGMFGSYQAMGKVSPVPVGDGTIVDVLLRFEAGEAMVWVRFDGDGKVTGIRLHPPPPTNG